MVADFRPRRPMLVTHSPDPPAQTLASAPDITDNGIDSDGDSGAARTAETR